MQHRSNIASASALLTGHFSASSSISSSDSVSLSLRATSSIITSSVKIWTPLSPSAVSSSHVSTSSAPRADGVCEERAANCSISYFSTSLDVLSFSSFS